MASPAASCRWKQDLALSVFVTVQVTDRDVLPVQARLRDVTGQILMARMLPETATQPRASSRAASMMDLPAVACAGA